MKLSLREGFADEAIHSYTHSTLWIAALISFARNDGGKR